MKKADLLLCEAKRAGRGGGQVENLVNLYLEIVNMGKDKRNSGGGNEEYWNNAVKQLLRNSISILPNIRNKNIIFLCYFIQSLNKTIWGLIIHQSFDFLILIIFATNYSQEFMPLF